MLSLLRLPFRFFVTLPPARLEASSLPAGAQRSGGLREMLNREIECLTKQAAHTRFGENQDRAARLHASAVRCALA